MIQVLILYDFRQVGEYGNFHLMMMRSLDFAN